MYMRYEIFIPILLLGVSNIFSWVFNYYNYQLNSDLGEKLTKIENQINHKNTIGLKEDKQIKDLKQIKEKIESINETIDNNKKNFNNKINNLQNSYNLFSGNFETKMKKKDNVIPHWFN